MIKRVSGGSFASIGGALVAFGGSGGNLLSVSNNLCGGSCALIGGIRRAREAGGDVAVACSRPTLTRLLHTTGFDRIVSVTETVEQAATALAESRPTG